MLARHVSLRRLTVEPNSVSADPGVHVGELLQLHGGGKGARGRRREFKGFSPKSHRDSGQDAGAQLAAGLLQPLDGIPED